MNGLDNHYSALWVQNERKQAEGKPTAKFTVSIAVGGYVDFVVEASSRAEAEEAAIDRLEVQGMTITETVVTDVEQWHD